MTCQPIRAKPSKTRSRRNKQITCGAASAVPPSLFQSIPSKGAAIAPDSLIFGEMS